MWKSSLREQLLGKPFQIFGLDAFRGIAALMVFGFHFYGFFLQNRVPLPNSIEPLLAGGHIGINIFFVLSGFLVFLSFIRTNSVWNYLWKRFIRIAPLAFAYLIVVFWYKKNFAPSDWHDLLIHASFIQSLFQDTYHGQYPVMWTLSIEWLFYLFVPIFAFVTRKNFKLFILGLLTLVLANWVYRGWMSQFFGEMNNFERIFYSEQLWGRFDHFALGILLAIGYSKGFIKQAPVIKNQALRILPYVLTILGLTSFIYLWYQFGIIGSAFRDQFWLQIFLHFSIALSFTVFLIGFIQLPEKKIRSTRLNSFFNISLKKIFAPTWLQYLGQISYGIYLWHFFVLEIFLETSFDLEQKILLVTTTTLGLSVLSWHLIEKPCLKFKNCLNKKKQV